MTDVSPLKAAAQHLGDRYPLLRDQDAARMVNAIASTDNRLPWRDIAVRHTDDFKGDRPPANREDALAALRLLADLRERFDADEKRLIDIARREKATWPQIAGELGLSSPQAAQQRRKRLESADRFGPMFLDPERNASADANHPLARSEEQLAETETNQ